MTLYRTVSDRGLWKKYQKHQPQHFHKPHYLDKDRPLVTYSQLNLGDNYRSYNSRLLASPNLRSADVNGHNSARGQNSESCSAGKSRCLTKSAPATPRSQTPDRLRSAANKEFAAFYNESNPNPCLINRREMESRNSGHHHQTPANGGEPAYQNVGHHHPSPTSRPTTSTSQYSGCNFDIEAEDRTSLESRSLAGYSPMSSAATGGREFSADRDVYPPHQYNYHHHHHGGSGVEGNRENPFAEGSALSREADNAVQRFLSSQANRMYKPSYERVNPGRIEDLAGPQEGRMQFDHIIDSFNYSSAPNCGSSTSTVISNVDRNTTETERPPQPKKTNKYLRPENRWQKPNAALPQNVEVVQSFKTPEMHHAEVVTLRQDETSTSSDPDSSNEAATTAVPAAAAPVSECDGSWRNGRRDQYDPVVEDDHDGSFSGEEDNFVAAGPKTKRNFFSSLFKKNGSGSKRGRKKKRPKATAGHIDGDDNGPIERSDEQSIYHVVPHQDEPVASLQTNDVHQIFPPPFSIPDERQKNGVEEQPNPKPLQRKLSMSKPTNLDDILRQQEEEERQQLHEELEASSNTNKVVTTSNAEDVFSNDPWFQSEARQLPAAAPRLPEKLIHFNSDQTDDPTKAYEQPVYANVPTFQPPTFPDRHDHETTQEIDVDAALGYCDGYDDGVEKAASEIDLIEWPRGSDEQIEVEEARINIEYDYSPNGKHQLSKKRSFFSFGKKKSKPSLRNEEKDGERTTAETYLVGVQTVKEIGNALSGQDGGKCSTSSDPSSSRNSSPEREVQKPNKAEKKRGFGGFFNKKLAAPAASDVDDGNKPDDQTAAWPAMDYTSAGDESQSRKQKANGGGIKGFFRQPGLKANRSKSTYTVVGNVEPVDVSHLVDEDDEYDKVMNSEPPLQTSQFKTATAPTVEADEFEGSNRRKFNGSPPHPQEGDLDVPFCGDENTRRKSMPQLAAPPPAPEDSQANSAARNRNDTLETRYREPVEMSPPQPTGHQDRGRKKSGGGAFRALFAPPKPRDDRPTTARPPRSRSWTRKSSSGGFSSLFGAPNNPRQRSTDGMPTGRIHVGQDPGPTRGNEGGLSNFFSVQPTKAERRHRRDQDRDLDDIASMLHEDDDDAFQADIHTRQRRPSNRGLSGLFASTRRLKKQKSHHDMPTSAPNPMRRSKSDHLPRHSETLSSLYRDEHESSGQSAPSAETLVATTQPEEKTLDESEQPEKTGTNEVDLQRRNRQEPETTPQTSSRSVPSRASEDCQQPKRQLGRRSGRFRRSTDATAPAVLAYGARPPKGTDGVVELEKTFTEQSIMRDMFVEQASRPTSRPASAVPSRRDSVTSVEDVVANMSRVYDDAKRPARKSTSSLGRTESYKQAKVGGEFNANEFEDVDADATNLSRIGQTRGKRYGSMPRLQNARTRPQQHPSLLHSRGGHRAEDPCKVM